MEASVNRTGALAELRTFCRELEEHLIKRALGALKDIPPRGIYGNPRVPKAGLGNFRSPKRGPRGLSGKFGKIK